MFSGMVLIKEQFNNFYYLIMFGGLLFCAGVERLCAIMNLVSIERDWVIVITDGNADALRTLNSQMRRIDLICKLFGPLVISFIDGALPLLICIYIVLGSNVVSTLVEYITAAKVYNLVHGITGAKACFSRSQ